MKTKKINVNPNNPENMFEDSELVRKIICVKYYNSWPEEYLVMGKSDEENAMGLKMAGVIRWNPIKKGFIDSFTAESLPGKPLHFAFAESISEGHPNYSNYEKRLQNAIK